MPQRLRLASGRAACLCLCLCLGLLATLAQAQPSPAAALERRPLPRDTVIGGIPCAKTARAPAEFYRSGGHLAGCALARAHTLAGHRFAAGTWLDVTPAGVLWGAWLSEHTPLDGHTCKGEGYKKWSTRFHPNGRLQGCYLVRDTIIEGVPCMAGTFWREIRGGGHTVLRLDGAGQVRRCQAARDTLWRGRPVRTWEVVHFGDPPGRQSNRGSTHPG